MQLQLFTQSVIENIVDKLKPLKLTLKWQLRGTFLVVQWLRIHLPMQGTRVWSLIQCRGHRFNVTRQLSLYAATTEPLCSRDCVPQLKKARAQQRRPSAAKKKAAESIRNINCPTLYQFRSFPNSMELVLSKFSRTPPACIGSRSHSSPPGW